MRDIERNKAKRQDLQNLWRKIQIPKVGHGDPTPQWEEHRTLTSIEQGGRAQLFYVVVLWFYSVLMIQLHDNYPRRGKIYNNCCGWKTNTQKLGCRDEHGVTQGFAFGCPAHPAISRSSTINRERYLLNRHSKQKNVTLNLDFSKSVTSLPKIQTAVFHDVKNRQIYRQRKI